MTVLSDLRALATLRSDSYSVRPVEGRYILRETSRSPRHADMRQGMLRYVVTNVFCGTVESVSGHSLPWGAGWADEATFAVPESAHKHLAKEVERLHRDIESKVLRWLTDAGGEGCSTRFWDKGDLAAAKRLLKAGKVEAVQAQRGKVVRYRVREERNGTA